MLGECKFSYNGFTFQFNPIIPHGLRLNEIVPIRAALYKIYNNDPTINEVTIPGTFYYKSEYGYIHHIIISQILSTVFELNVDKSLVKKINIPKSVWKIENHAFADLYYTEEINFYDFNFKEMGIDKPVYGIIQSRSFSNIPLLKKLIIPDVFFYMEEQAIYNCKSLETVIVENNSIKNNYFIENIFCPNLKHIKYNNRLLNKGKDNKWKLSGY